LRGDIGAAHNLRRGCAEGTRQHGGGRRATGSCLRALCAPTHPQVCLPHSPPVTQGRPPHAARHQTTHRVEADGARLAGDSATSTGCGVALKHGLWLAWSRGRGGVIWACGCATVVVAVGLSGGPHSRVQHHSPAIHCTCVHLCCARPPITCTARAPVCRCCTTRHTRSHQPHIQPG
jgi:hypothetical protein